MGKEKDDIKEIEDRLDAFSVDELEGFFLSPIWKCIEADMKDRYQESTMMIEDAPKEDVFGTDAKGRFGREASGVNRLQGEMNQLRMFIALPVLYIQDKQQMLEQEKGEE